MLRRGSAALDAWLAAHVPEEMPSPAEQVARIVEAMAAGMMDPAHAELGGIARAVREADQPSAGFAETIQVIEGLQPLLDQETLVILPEILKAVARTSRRLDRL